ncbi:IucA/IucC family protein [Methylobacter sp.]|uniref:IucA/IucC family protein n=1 Tax=Methylobacter sp. TaxID=2051955 RepID=UPI002486FCAC|nr:IucA/IucC family protein [Methylobacter sp.]MDI1279312.1 IucA/IucC family protein [Methylobacter sp.]MDI1360086.1 IucA/IucC family protein [Methylobacter sp.]
MNSQLKFFLVAMVAVSVISDSMLVPFYPQFFATAFSITAPQHVGLYLSAICFVVMLAFPLWADAAKHIPVLRLLVYTQFAAGVLSILCYESDSLPDFWFVSLLMQVFKGSYLLTYPFVMSLEHKDRHGGTIGLLSVIVHLGAIAGAGIAARHLVCLGFVEDVYLAQQSIRTFFNTSHPHKRYVKTALSILNMGFMLGLSPYYMSTTPAH